VSEKFSSKTIENEVLKTQLQEAESRVSHVELERDLNQADAAKLREDLKTVISKMFDISMYESSDPTIMEKKIDKIGRDPHQYKKNLENVHSLYNTFHNKTYLPGMQDDRLDPKAYKTATTVSSTTEKIRILGLIDQPKNRHTIRRQPIYSDPGLTRSQSQCNNSSEADNIRLLPDSRGNQTLRNQNVFRKRSHSVARYPKTDIVRIKRKHAAVVSPDSRRKGTKNDIFRRHQSLSAIDTKSTGLITEHKQEEEVKENRRCGLSFRRRSKHQSFSREGVRLLEQQIARLNENTKTSLVTSEKLRKKLTTITRYYEGVISKLGAKVAEAKMEKSRTEVRLAHTISQADVERRLFISKFEKEIQRKQKEIERLKAEGDRGEV